MCTSQLTQTLLKPLVLLDCLDRQEMPCLNMLRVGILCSALPYGVWRFPIFCWLLHSGHNFHHCSSAGVQGPACGGSARGFPAPLVLEALPRATPQANADNRQCRPKRRALCGEVNGPRQTQRGDPAAEIDLKLA